MPEIHKGFLNDYPFPSIFGGSKNICCSLKESRILLNQISLNYQVSLTGKWNSSSQINKDELPLEWHPLFHQLRSGKDPKHTTSISCVLSILKMIVRRYNHICALFFAATTIQLICFRLFGRGINSALLIWKGDAKIKSNQLLTSHLILLAHSNTQRIDKKFFLGCRITCVGLGKIVTLLLPWRKCLSKLCGCFCFASKIRQMKANW